MKRSERVSMPRFEGVLLPEHVAVCEAQTDRWMTAGLSTERCDRPAVEAAVRRVYESAGLSVPGVVVWMDSPLGGALAAEALHREGQFRGQLRGQLRVQLRDQLGDQLSSQLRDQGQLRGQLSSQLGGQLRGQLGGQFSSQLRDQFRGQLRDQFRGQLSSQLSSQLRDQLGDQLSSQLRDQGQLRGQLSSQLGGQLWGQLKGQLGGQLCSQLRDQFRGQLGDQFWEQLWLAFSSWHDAFWMALYTVALPATGLPLDPLLDALADLTTMVGYWWPLDGAVILAERPTAIHRDGQGRLHSTTGPALEWADGHTLHAVGGVRVDADIVERPETITVERILTHGNAEQRRVMIDLRGWDWFTTAADLRLVDEAPDPGNTGETIALYDLPEQVYDEPVRVLLCTNASLERDGTRRRFGLTVPADCTTAVGAAAWTFGTDEATYGSLVRAT